MKFVDLAQHLRQLRFVRTGRSSESAMSAIEVWQGAEQCPDNGIGKIRFRSTELPRPFDGLFARYADPQAPGRDPVVILIDRRLPQHWRDFVLIKELMHCWSPEDTRVQGPQDAAQLITALNIPTSRYPASAAADLQAVQAAAEVILPHYVVERELIELAADNGHQQDVVAEVANRHGLHPEVAQLICRHDLLVTRKVGCL